MLIKKLFVVVLLLLLSTAIYAQPRDTAMEISLENYYIDGINKSFSFDIHLTRITDTWHLWKNATFQMEFRLPDDLTEINYQNYDVAIDISETEVFTSYTSKPFFAINAEVLDDRVVMIVMGAENYDDAKHFDKMSKLKLCKVILKAKDTSSPVPYHIYWKEPMDYYQTTAYVYLDGINSVPSYVLQSNDADHIEIAWHTKFAVAPMPYPLMLLDLFEVAYLGNLNIVCRYSTLSEANNKGFVIKRAEYSYFIDNLEELPDEDFAFTLGDYRIPEFTSRMTGQLNSFTGKKYAPIPDKVEARVLNYVYRLYYDEEGETEIKKLATKNLITPNAVITKATAFPNPCSGVAKIEYVVADDVYLLCEVYDQLGNRIKTLSDNINGYLNKTYVKAGQYFADFAAPELASQGLYDVVFTAYPVNDESVEISRAVVKIQLLKGYYYE